MMRKQIDVDFSNSCKAQHSLQEFIGIENQVGKTFIEAHFKNFSNELTDLSLVKRICKLLNLKFYATAHWLVSSAVVGFYLSLNSATNLVIRPPRLERTSFNATNWSINPERLDLHNIEVIFENLAYTILEKYVYKHIISEQQIDCFDDKLLFDFTDVMTKPELDLELTLNGV